jgi:DNA polymerase-3 subunit epsilon
VELSKAIRIVEAQSDLRLLRRVPAPADWSLKAGCGETRRGIFVDTETTGLDLESDEVIELALLPFEYERETGLIVSVDHAGALSAFRAPSKPIPAESTLIHGISDEMVRGHVIDEARVRAIVEPAHIVLAHNAGFDRGMLEKHWPVFEDKHWACSLEEIDWRGEGLGSARLDYLLWARGFFHEGHRALSDAEAALFLLTLPLPRSGRVALEMLLANARLPLWLVRAENTAFEQRASLKARGYRWDDGGGKRVKAWWIMSNDPQSELEWLRSDIYGDEGSVRVLKVPATKRYSSRVWEG